jgi:hypothetical protein
MAWALAIMGKAIAADATKARAKRRLFNVVTVRLMQKLLRVGWKKR